MYHTLSFLYFNKVASGTIWLIVDNGIPLFCIMGIRRISFSAPCCSWINVVLVVVIIWNRNWLTDKAINTNKTRWYSSFTLLRNEVQRTRTESSKTLGIILKKWTIYIRIDHSCLFRSFLGLYKFWVNILH